MPDISCSRLLWRWDTGSSQFSFNRRLRRSTNPPAYAAPSSQNLRRLLEQLRVCAPQLVEHQFLEFGRELDNILRLGFGGGRGTLVLCGIAPVVVAVERDPEFPGRTCSGFEDLVDDLAVPLRGRGAIAFRAHGRECQRVRGVVGEHESAGRAQGLDAAVAQLVVRALQQAGDLARARGLSRELSCAREVCEVVRA